MDSRKEVWVDEDLESSVSLIQLSSNSTLRDTQVDRAGALLDLVVVLGRATLSRPDLRQPDPIRS